MRSAAALLLFFACSSRAPSPDAAQESEPDAQSAPPPDARPGLSPDLTADSGAPPTSHDATPDDSPVPSDASIDRAPDAREADAPGPADMGTATLRLTSTGFLVKGADLIFPASASYPMDQSPPFEWSGAPAATASFALTFVDESNGATKWVVWDIPAGVSRLPGNLSKTVHPSEVPAASQRGSLGRTGYSGPGVEGPPLHVYQFEVWALDVQKLQNTDGLSTVDLRTKLLPMHGLAHSAPLVAKGQLGGP
jgi:Raf kinase inhibitor-like YbhB/YbcL family protein